MHEPHQDEEHFKFLVFQLLRQKAASLTLQLLLWLGVIAILAAVILPNFIHRGCGGGTLTGCKSNLKNMATALEMYASDYAGEYPTSWAQMTAGHYLKSVPTCPAANLMTYSYRRTGTGKQAGFYLQCCGSHHAKAYSAFPNSPHNFPRYSSETGLGYHP